MSDKALSHLEKTLGYTFTNKKLLRTALTHKTYAFEAKTPLEYNERLEFLGDSVLGTVVAEQLYKGNRYFSEGDLTRRRSNGVNNRYLAKRAETLGIGSFVLFGRGELKQHGAKNQTNLANALEAIIGAMYLDSSLERVQQFIIEKVFTKDFQF